MQAFNLGPQAVWHGGITFSPDGRWLALNGKPFSLLDTLVGERVELPLGDFRWGYTFVRGGSALAYLPGSKVLCEYNLATRTQIKRKIADGYANSIASDPQGEALYSSVSQGYNGLTSIRVLSVKEKMKEQADFGAVTDDLRGLRMSADGRWIGATSFHRVRAWHLGGKKLPGRASLCAKPKSSATQFAISAAGEYLAITTMQGLEIWSTSTGKREAYSGKHRRGVTAVACCPTRPVLVTGDNAGKVFLWDYAGRVLTRYEWGLGEVRSLAFAPDGLRCAAVDRAGKLVLWDVDV